MRIKLILILLPLISINIFAQDKAKAIAIFKEYTCHGCHSIEDHNIEVDNSLDKGVRLEKDEIPPDLSQVGSKHLPEWIHRWLQKKEEKKGKTHKRMFKGSMEEREILVNWLSSLK